MTDADMVTFGAVLRDVYSFYRVDLTPGASRIWKTAMKAYSLDAVTDALGRHCMNPDSGQFLPKPADVTKMIGGTSKDAALLAWAAVDQAVRLVGPWQSVAFDDAIIHKVIEDMGGWVKVSTGSATEKDFVFVGNEFENRYRGYLIRSDVGEYPRILMGQSAVHNAQCGGPPPAPVLIGDSRKAMAVITNGVTTARVGMVRMSPDAMEALAAPQREAPRRLR